MNLINKKLLQQKLHSFEFPDHERLANSRVLLEKWVKALKDSDLEGTKEKSVQGKFLSTFLEDILGYSDVTTGNEEWTLIQHPRIENDSKEPDGSLGWFTKDKKITKAVIELKDAKALLDKKQNRGSEKLTPIEQAYLYATKYEGCNWIIVSNFKEIRLYNKNRTQEYYEKFDVVDLIQETEFKRFYFLLSKETLISKEKESIVDVLAKDTTEAEQDITKKFYSEFREVRMKLLGHLSDNNPEFEKELLLEKTQKLLDRFIFTLFCEDTSTLLPLNLVKNTYERAINSLSPSDERVWTEFKGLFLAIDRGNNRVKPPINAYNGGLFALDMQLDTLSIKDEFWANLMHLTEYDFETDLNVNILGHIFEQSISDLESLKSELRGEEQDKKKSKRKKDGIFYTPEYITRYIVENTLGKYLEEHPEKLETIKILDPACGSGAFLNQAHSFLVKEYTNRYEALINEKMEKGESITLFDYNPAENNRNILLNNLYGVDLNQESVEITKLAMWLKTARATEPLQNLDRNIKTGNSLIDDPEIAGSKAFNWNDEFKDIMQDGGFDVIIGNPPYIYSRDSKFSEEEQIYFRNNSELITHRLNTFILFIERSFKLLNQNGYLGFIVPNNWMTVDSFYPLRNFILDRTGDIRVLNIPKSVFDDASVDTCILLFSKRKDNKISLGEFNEMNLAEYYGTYPTNYFDIVNRNLNIKLAKNNTVVDVLNRIDSNSSKLNTIAQLKHGIVAYLVGDGIPKQTVQIRDQRAYHTDIQVDDTYRRYLNGRAVSRYNYLWSGEYIKYGKNLARRSQLEYFQSPRILIKQIPSTPPYCINSVFIEDEYINDINSELILADRDTLLYILGVINSKPFSQWFQLYFDKFQRKIFPQVKLKEMEQFAIPIANKADKDAIGSWAFKLQELHTKKMNATKGMTEFANSQFNTEFRKIDFLDGWNKFTELVAKMNIKLSLEKKEEIFAWFKTKQAEFQELETKIVQLENQIDQCVYKLYGFVGEEIQVVENSLETK